MSVTDAPVREALALLAEGRDLSEDLAERTMDALMSGAATSAQIGALLMGLRLKGETVEEISALARAMRAHSVRIQPGVAGLVDVCGTGGARLKTFNVSTAAAFVVAGAGAPVAKHGNRSNASPSGSADVLESLGLNLSAAPEAVCACIERTGIGFLFAPVHHPAMKYAIGPRKEMGVRTVFNMLGPLTNPASASYHLMGVFDPALVESYPYVLQKLGVRKALVVHGLDGLDELSTLGESAVGELSSEGVRHYRLWPESFGLKPARIEDVGSVPPEDGAEKIRALLGGARDAHYEIVLLNAGAALYAAERADSIEAGLAQAQEAIQSGAAREKLEQLIAYGQDEAPRG